MIKNINANGKYLQVTGGSGATYVNGYSGLQGVGNMRYNTSTQTMEVFDGNGWISMQMGYATVALTPDAENLLDWAKKKRDEEMELEALAKTNPTIADLRNQIKEKQEQIQMVKNLSKSDKEWKEHISYDMGGSQP